MRRTRGIPLYAVAVLAMLLTLVVGKVLAQEKIDLKKNARPDGKVVIQNVSGSVDVIGWQKEEIQVQGTLGQGTERLDFKVDGKRAKIKVVLPKGLHKSVKGSYLKIHVPEGSRVHVSTVSADIDARDLAGELDLETVSGDLAAAGRPSVVGAETVSGEIELEVEAAEVDAHSVSGDLTLRGVRGEVTAETVSGDILVRGGEVGRFRAETVSGDIRFAGELSQAATVSCESQSGDVELRLPASTDAEFDISTFSGDIENEFGPPAQRRGRFEPGKELEFTTGSGAADVKVESFSGDVRLLKE